MKKLVLLVAFMVMASALVPATVQAGDNGWATVGKILTGVVVAQVLLGNGPPARCETVVMQQPVYPAVTCYSAPVYCERVCYPVAVTYVRPAPTYGLLAPPRVAVQVYRSQLPRRSYRRPPAAQHRHAPRASYDHCRR